MEPKQMKTEQLIKLSDYTNYDTEELLNRFGLNESDVFANSEKMDELECINELMSIPKRNFTTIPFDNSGDQDKNISIIQRSLKGYQTQQYIGLIQLKNGKDIFIKSRFDEGENCYFSKYILSKAYNLKLSLFKDMKPRVETGQFIEFLLLFVFIYQINQAYLKGIYRQYCIFECNDDKLKGKIDIARHIRLNPIFNGKIAYSYREYTINNSVNRLILTAYVYLEKKNKQLLKELTQQYKNVADYIRCLKNVMQPFSKQEIPKAVCRENKKITHSIYRDWEEVRKTAILILRHFGIDTMEKPEHQTTGILINMNKIWELYIESILKDKNVRSISLETQTTIPYLWDMEKDKNKKVTEIKTDFLFKDESQNAVLVLDAKYKNGWQNVAEKVTANEEKIEWPREDIYQILAYMHILNCNQGGIVCPLKTGIGDIQDKNYKKYKKYLVGGENFRKEWENFFIIPIAIPRDVENETPEELYKRIMKQSEKNLYNAVKVILEDYVEKVIN